MLCNHGWLIDSLLRWIGATDIIAQFDQHRGVLAAVEETGSMRRCGGQGDILAGCLGVIMHWALQVWHRPLLSYLNASQLIIEKCLSPMLVYTRHANARVVVFTNRGITVGCFHFQCARQTSKQVGIRIQKERHDLTRGAPAARSGIWRNVRIGSNELSYLRLSSYRSRGCKYWMTELWCNWACHGIILKMHSSKE